MVRERWDLPRAEKFWEKRGVQRCLGDGLGGTESACQGAMSERGFEKERCTCGCLAMLYRSTCAEFMVLAVAPFYGV